MGSSGGGAFPQEIWDWAFDQIPGIAKKYRGIEHEELEAQLAVKLLEIRLRPNPTAHDWKPYLIQCLHRRASYLAQRSRKRQQREPGIEAISSLSEPAEQDPKPLSAARMHLFRRGLGNADRRLLKELEQCNWSVSELARRRACHRNTIHRRLRELRRTRCPIEIETAPTRPGPESAQERAELEAIIRQPSRSARRALRARVIVALLDGHGYEQIEQDLGSSKATIARWRYRFEKRGVAGLIPWHRGKRPSHARMRLRKWLRSAKPAKIPSVRHLARQFRLGKSTVQRILKRAG